MLNRAALIAGVLSSLSISGAQAADASLEAWRPTPEQQAGIKQICEGWATKSGGVYLLKTSGAGRPTSPDPNPQLMAKIVDFIFDDSHGITTKELAETAGFQFCVEDYKPKFRDGDFIMAPNSPKRIR
jgi:hypothetical protein